MLRLTTLAMLPLAADPTPPRIFGGEEVIDDFDQSATVAIRTGPVLCTGTVVHPRLVITAAHCIVNAPEPDTPENFYILFGKQALDAPTAATNAVQVGVHPDYGGPDCLKDCFDLGYLVPAADVMLADGYPTFITSQDEYDREMTVGAPVRFVGYGRDESNTVGVKRSVVSEVTSFFKSGKEFWAGGEGKDTCLGDSGGPALLELGDGSQRLVGVVSRGEDCGEGGVFGNPYTAACWIRDETGIDMADGCETCDCVKLSKREPDDGCAVSPASRRTGGHAGPWGLGLVVAVWGFGRWRRVHRRAADTVRS